MKLADYLAENQISHRDFAAKLGVSQAAITRYVNGDRTPHPRIMRMIYAATNGAVTPNDFLASPPAASPPFPIHGGVS